MIKEKKPMPKYSFIDPNGYDTNTDEILLEIAYHLKCIAEILDEKL
jgi:hypothetical protein